MATPLLFDLSLDESGTHGPSKSQADRYLTIAGVLMRRHAVPAFHSHLTEIKREFIPASSGVVNLHWVEVEKRRGPFACLSDSELRHKFNLAIVGWIGRYQYHLFSVAIDKHGHDFRYGCRAWHPYHYAVEVLMERVCLFLKRRGRAEAIISAESRGSRNDDLLASAWQRALVCGKEFTPAEDFAAAFPNEQIYFKNKGDDDPGIQLADVVAVHAKASTLVDAGLKKQQANALRRRVAQKLEPRYDSYRGEVRGCGRKLLSPPPGTENGTAGLKPGTPRSTTAEAAVRA